MANFNTHLTVAASVSSVLSIGLLFTDLITVKAAFFYGLLGILGGILPDIDAPKSIPTRILFTLLGILLATLIVVNQFKQLSWFKLTSLWIISYLGIFYGLSLLFQKLTIHRGNFHSILAALFFGFFTTATAYHLLELSEKLAWFAGLFVIAGYLIHLLLDELYSVDLTNIKLKQSFGTALKIASFRHQLSSLLLLLATIEAFLLTPNTDTLVKLFLY